MKWNCRLTTKTSECCTKRTNIPTRAQNSPFQHRYSIARLHLRVHVYYYSTTREATWLGSHSFTTNTPWSCGFTGPGTMGTVGRAVFYTIILQYRYTCTGTRVPVACHVNIAKYNIAIQLSIPVLSSTQCTRRVYTVYSSTLAIAILPRQLGYQYRYWYLNILYIIFNMPYYSIYMAQQYLLSSMLLQYRYRYSVLQAKRYGIHVYVHVCY